MLSTDQISDVVRNLGATGNLGRTEALRRANRDGLRSDLTMSQQRFLAAADQVHRDSTPPRYAHPAEAATFDARARGDKPLTPAELAWLSRLPSDPQDVSFDDARQVFSLLNSVAAPDEVRLLRSIADPIREFHDTMQAHADLARTEASAPLAAPQETLPALADAVAAENDQLEPDEAVSRASRMLTDLGQQRLADHAQRLAAARARIDEVGQTTAKRLAVHR